MNEEVVGIDLYDYPADRCWFNSLPSDVRTSWKLWSLGPICWHREAAE